MAGFRREALLRILICAWRDLANPLAGGSEVLIDRIAGGMTERGHDVTLLAGGPVADREYEVVNSGGTYSQYLRAPLRYLKDFRDADLVVDVCNGMPFLTPFWRRGPSVCFVNHVHTEQWRVWFPPAMAAIGRNIERHVVPLAYRERLFVAVSPSTARSLTHLGVDARRIRIVHNGVDMPTCIGEKSPEPLFLALGRLVPHKRIDLLLRVWDQVRRETGGRLVVAGSGPEGPALAAMAGDGVELVGQISPEDKARLLSEAWLLLHPSMLEGWGLVIMEAAAAGTPTIGFDVPGVRDSVVDGVSGVLVRSEDELAREWVALTADAIRRSAMSEKARDVAAQYAWSRTVDAFESVALEAVERGRPIPARPRPRVAPVPARAAARIAHPAAGTPALSIVVPAFNEAARLRKSLPVLLEAIEGANAELIVVDDGSYEDTAQVARALLAKGSQRDVVRLQRHSGKGAAVRAGIERARGDAIVFMDADLATDVSHLPEVVAALDTNHVVVGSRAAPGAVTSGASLARTHMGRAFNRMARTVTGLPVSDFQCGFKAFRAPTAKMLFHLSQLDGFAFDVEILFLAAQIGYRIAEVPVQWQAVPGGHVRPSKDAPLMAMDVLRTRLRWTRGRTLATVRASCGDPSGATEAVAALTPHLRVFDSVVPWRDGALGFLPFLRSDEAAEIAERVQHELPDLLIQAESIPAWELLAPSAHSLRTALAAA